MASCTVYGIYDALGELRYVGQTRNPLWKRLADHICKADQDAKRPVLRWLWDVYSAGGAVTIAPLKTNAVPNVDEKKIIKQLIADGRPLLNIDHTPAKSALVRQTFADPELKAKRSRIQSERMTPERRASLSARMKGVPKTAEHRAKIAAGRRLYLAENSQERAPDGTYC